MPGLSEQGSRAVWLLIGGSALAVGLYNAWAYCCGRCRVTHFLTLGPFGSLLIGLNLATLAVLIVLKLRRRRSVPEACPCGRLPASDWRFCGACGRPLADRMHNFPAG